jgi:hypothetical protein
MVEAVATVVGASGFLSANVLIIEYVLIPHYKKKQR